MFDLSGREVATLASGSFAAGEHAVVWDARDRSGNPVANGTYFYRLQTDGQSKVRKLVVVR